MTLGHCCEDGLGAKLGRQEIGTLDLSLALAVSCRTVMCSLGRRGRGPLMPVLMESDGIDVVLARDPERKRGST